MNDNRMREYFIKRENILRRVNEIISSLQNYSNVIDNNIVDSINKLYKDSLDFVNESKILLDEPGDSYKNTIVESTRLVKDNVKLVKKELVFRYNSEIETINSKVNELGLLTDNRLEGFDIPSKFNKRILFNANLRELDFDKINELRNQVNEVLKEVSEEKNINDAIESFVGSVTNLENDIFLLKKKLDKNLIDKNEFLDELSRMNALFEEKYYVVNDSNNSLKLSEEQVNELNSRLGKVSINLLILDLNSRSKNFNNNNVNNKYYLELKERIEMLSSYLEYYNNLFVYPKEGTFDINNIKMIEDCINEYDKKLEEIRKQVNIYYKGYVNRDTNERVVFFDKLSYDNLNLMIDKVQSNINELRNKFKEPKVFNEESAPKVMDNNLSNIDKKMDELDEKIAKLEFILSKKDKRDVNNLINSISDDIGLLDGMISNDSYYMEKMNKRKARFVEIVKVCNNKTPKRVTKVESANSLYKKYEESCLLSAGLAVCCLTDGNVGSTLIPAVMHANEVEGKKFVSKGEFSNGINNVLGSMINAKKDKDGWVLSNGIRNNSSTAKTSVLKGIVSSKTDSKKDGILNKLVNQVKKLSIKMKSKELKDTYKNGIDMVDNQVKELNDEYNDLDYIYNKGMGGRR